jgi:hypothetical protein
MALKAVNKNFESALQQKLVNIERALVYRLEAYVEELINDAKLSGEYNDQTGNLRSSIGGVLLKNRKPITYRGFVPVAGGTHGAIMGKDFLNRIAAQLGTGYVILIVAGMEYASYVEQIHSLNVLSLTEMKAVRELPGILKEIRDEV